ncbi:16375_t:CDS:1, partial [Racocetra fulgida]
PSESLEINPNDLFNFHFLNKIRGNYIKIEVSCIERLCLDCNSEFTAKQHMRNEAKGWLFHDDKKLK